MKYETKSYKHEQGEGRGDSVIGRVKIIKRIVTETVKPDLQLKGPLKENSLRMFMTGRVVHTFNFST